MKLITIFLGSFLLCFCTSRDNPIIDVKNIPDTGVVIRKWQVLGPIPERLKSNNLNDDNIKDFDLSELNMKFKDYKNITPIVDNADSSKISNRLINFSDHLVSKFNYQKGNVYAGCIIRSDKEVQLRLNIGIYPSVKVWLNQRPVPNNGRSKQNATYWHYLPLNLNKGDNFLLIKINNDSDKGWDMYAAIEKESQVGMLRHELAFITAHNHNFLETALITDSVFNNLMVNSDFVTDKYQLNLSVGKKKLFHKSFSNPRQWKLNLSKLQDGLYSVQLRKGNITLDQYIFKGDIVKSVAQLIRNIRHFNMTPEITANVNALVSRYHIILKKPLIAPDKSGTQGRQIRMIILYRQLLNVYKQLKANKSPYSHNSGTFIRTYTSEIDNSVQNYILHVPKSYSEGKKFPVIFNTAIASSKTPYLESIRVNNSYVILNYGELANKYNVLVAELNGRTTDKHNYNTIEETEFFEVLKSIKEDYSVDSSRVYLTGFCMGGWSALKLATKYPDKFAAISLNASGYKLSDIDNKWLKQNEPLKYLSNLKNVPILQVHSELDHHTDIEIGDVLNYEMKKNDLDRVTYNRLPPGARYFYTEGFEFYDQSFAYLCKQKILAPTEVHFTTGHLKNNHAYWVKLNAISYSREASIHAKIRDNFLAINCKNVISYSIDLKQLPYQKDRRLRIVENGKEVYYALARKSNLTFNKQPGTRVNLSKTHNVEGPLAHVFTRKFVLVTGTLGNQIEDKRLNSLADSIDTLWSNRYLVSCNRKMDIDITKKDFLNSNLILLGNAGSNSIIHRIIKNIPLKIASDYIQVGDKRLLGNRLGFYMVYPNPLNSRKYIAIIGYNNPSYMSLGFERFDGITFRDISNYGWYDYKIWQVSNQEDALIGYFNSTWNTTNK